jgi:hypothetical protein
VWVRWARAHCAEETLAGAFLVVPWQLLMRRAQLQRARCCGAMGTGTPCGTGASRCTPCGSLAATADKTSAAAEATVLWCGFSRAYLAEEPLAGALPVVPWQLLLMRRAQLQRTRCAGALSTGTPCGRGASRRTPCGSLAAAADATSAAAEGTVLWCGGHGHTLRDRQ